MTTSTKNIQIPKHWTGKQANAVVEFLYGICDAVWSIYDSKILDAMEHQKVIHPPPEEDEICEIPDVSELPW